MSFWPKKADETKAAPAGAGGTKANPTNGIASSLNDLSFARPLAAPGDRATAPESTLPPDPTAPKPVTAGGGSANTLPTLTPEQQKEAALASKMMMAAYGEIVSVLSRSPAHRELPLSELDNLAVPAVLSGQFSLAETQSKTNGFISPIGLVLWANVSPEVDRRLADNIATGVRLKAEGWKSGDILWLVDAIGDPRIIEAMLKRLVQTEWKGRDARMRARTKDGMFKVGVISAVAVSATQPPPAS